MNVALVAGEYPPMQGGLGDFTRQLARAIAARGHAVHVITRKARREPAERTQSAVSVAHVDGVVVHRIVARWGWGARALVERIVRDNAIDVVNLQYQAAAYQMHGAINLLPRQLRTSIAAKTFVTFHDLRVPYLFPKAGSLRWRSILWMAGGAHGVIVTNEEDHTTLALHNISSHVIPIGSNIAPAQLNGFDREAWMAAHGIPSGTRLFGTFGFMNESKGGDALIRALGEMKMWRVKHGSESEVLSTLHAPPSTNPALLFIGEQLGASDPTNASYQRHLNQLIDELGVRDRVYETGFLDDRGVSEAFAACYCVALPYRDGVSFRRGTLMAALAHGCAIVTTQPRVVLTQIRDEHNLLLVPADDPSAVARAIQRVMTDAALRAQLGAGALELAKAFTWDAIAGDSLALFGRA